MDPTLEEFCRINMLGNFQTHSFRRMQRYFQSELGPKIDRLEAENAELRAKVEAFESGQIPVETHVFGEVDQPAKRKRGRPRKSPIEEPIPV